MAPSLAISLWLVLLICLLWFDPARDPGASLALWVPVTWMFIVGSRLPSQWLGGQVGIAAEAFEEGDSLDRSVYLVLIVLAIIILVSRPINWSGLFAQNFFLTAFLAFALLSVFWSDFPLVTFKRWFRDLGHYLMVLIVLSDPRPLEAVRTVLRRLCYLLIPLSIVLIKYYPQLGIEYFAWTGTPLYRGVTTGKNQLGALCLTSGIFFFWETLTCRAEGQQRTRQIILVNLGFLAATLWLLHITNSATARICLVIGCLVMLAVRRRSLMRHSAFIKVLIPASFCLYLILAFGFHLNGALAQAAGRDPTLTDRTKIWQILLNMNTNPVIGTSYEGFWLGPRLEWVWRRYGVGLNEAHNGYLEVYLNLGLVGLFLLGGFLISSYRAIWRRPRFSSNLNSLNLALWITTLFYNMAEATFRFHWVWVTFLLGAVAVPSRAEERVTRLATLDHTGPSEQFPGRLRKDVTAQATMSKSYQGVKSTGRMPAQCLRLSNNPRGRHWLKRPDLPH